MKNLYRFYFLILFGFVMINMAFSQKKGYETGYVITLGNDTIQGLIRDRDSGPFEELYAQVRFIPQGKWWRKKYSPYEINGYTYQNSNFESVPLDDETMFFITRYYTQGVKRKVFLKRVQQNEYLTHYEKEFMGVDNNYIESFPLFHRKGAQQMVRVTQGILGIKRKRLKEYFDDCPALVSAIESGTLKSTQALYDFYSTVCH